MSTINRTAHGFTAGTEFYFGNIVPDTTGVVEGQVYYVLAAGLTADAFQFSETDGGAAFTLSEDIISGIISEVPFYSQVTDPADVHAPPETPVTPDVPVLSSDIHELVVRLKIELPAVAGNPLRTKEVQVTMAHTLGVPIWETAIVYTPTVDQTELAIGAFGGIDYWVRWRTQDVYGQYSEWSDVGSITTVAGPDSRGIENSVSTVYVDATGLHVLDGAISISDGYGTVVLGAGGFGRPWLAYLYYGFYNATMENADQTDIPPSEVSGGATLANYEASLSTLLPYWVVGSASAGTLVGRDDADASGGVVLRSFNGSGAAQDLIYQDIPVFPGKRRSLYIRYKATVTSGSVDLRVYHSYRTSTHALIGSRVTVDTISMVTSASFATQPYFPSALAPTNAAYSRFEIEVRHVSGSNIVDIDTVYAPEDTDIRVNTIEADVIQVGPTAPMLSIIGPTSHDGDFELSGRLLTVDVHHHGGASLPLSPVSDDQFFHTDYDMWFVYNGTNWVCTCPHTAPFVPTTTTTEPITATAGNRWHAAMPVLRGLDVRVEGVDCAFLVVSGATALGASHRWNANIRSVPTDTIIASLTINSGANDTWRNTSDSGADFVDITGSQVALSLSWAKTGTPGNLTHQVIAHYRYIVV